jgi:hypothetical protein
MKFSDVSRYEFRQFGADLKDICDRFAALGEGEKHPARRETYIVTRLNIESNIKTRAGKLEVKVLRGRQQMLELWERTLSTDFPVSVEDVEKVVLPPLGLDLEIGERGALTESALMALVSGQHALATIEIEKERTLFDLGDCEAEFCKLRIGDDQLHTISIETPDAIVAADVLAKVGLSDAANESYAEYLQRRLF